MGPLTYSSLFTWKSNIQSHFLSDLASKRSSRLSHTGFQRGQCVYKQIQKCVYGEKKKKRPRDNLVKEENDELFFYISTVLFSRLMVNYSCLGVNEINK